MAKMNPIYPLAMLAMVTLPSAALAARWVNIGSAKDSPRIEVDASSQHSPGEGRTRLWHRESTTKPRRPESEAFSYTRVMTLSEFQCDKRLAATLQQSYTGIDGSTINADAVDSAPRPVTPDTPLEAVLAYACKPPAKPVVAAPPPAPAIEHAEPVIKKKTGKKGQEEPPPPPPPPPHWGYHGNTGPDKWGSLHKDFAVCSLGQRQSPIDIRKTVKADLPPIDFAYKGIPLSIVDNGHSIKVDTPEAGSIALNGERYELLQFHFHKPSEEKINGKAYDLVAHLVHQSKEGKLAVVAILFEAGKKEHALIQTLWSNLPLEQDVAVKRKDVRIDLNDLLPRKRNYFTFLGSLTTPPCTEGVLWLVLKTPVQVSKEQLAGFSTIYRNNVRPVQPVNDRVIKEGR